MSSSYKNLHFWLVLALDILLLAAAHLLAYEIRFEGQLSPTEWANIRSILPLFILFKLVTFSTFGLYRGMWRYTSMIDLVNILKACLLTSFVAISVIFLATRFQNISRAVFLLDGVFTFLVITGHRVAIRLYYQKAIHFSFGSSGADKKGGRKNLLIIGAGDAGEKTIREVQDSSFLKYNIVGLIDDDPAKMGKRIHGIPIRGPVTDLEKIIEGTGAEEILIAIPSASTEQMKLVIAACQDSALPFKTLPSVSEIIDGRVDIKDIRDVSYSDLLGRPKVILELDKIQDIISSKTILVTGAGGTIGSELCRQILRFNPGKMILFDAGEENLYRIEMEIRHELGFENYVTVLGKVQNESLLDHVFAHYRPEVVFHAAAYKHVPLIEQNPWEAVYNNILASKHLMDSSVKHGVARFILVSTDKAVRPTNVMGASKRVTEILMQNYCMNGRIGESANRREDITQRATRFMAVRFGNVLGSSGSVIPLFRRQIEMGGPVTVTDPKITRFFMSIEEAAQLILQACSLSLAEPAEDTHLCQGSGGQAEVGLKKVQGDSPSRPIAPSPHRPVGNATGGEIFILEMGTPVKIDQMARDLIKLCGKEPDTEIEIIYTGLRPGEKLYEELITEGEGIVPTGHEKIMVLRPNGAQETIEHRTSNAQHRTSNEDPGQSTNKQLTLLNKQIKELEALAHAHDAAGIRAKLKEIVVDYSPKESKAIL